MSGLFQRKENIDALITSIKSDYVSIHSLYEASLSKKELDPSLKIKVKNYLENARSILDYCAHDIADKLGIKKEKIYFPFVNKTTNIDGFKSEVGRNLPNLEMLHENLYKYIESLQPYHSAQVWLANFIDIVNNHKHQDLTPQIKTESPSLSISNKSTRMSFSGGASMVIGRGASISIGGARIFGGQTINANSQQIFGDPALTIKKEIWVDFKFNDSISALPLLKKIHDEIPVIIFNIYKLL